MIDIIREGAEAFAPGLDRYKVNPYRRGGSKAGFGSARKAVAWNEGWIKAAITYRARQHWKNGICPCCNTKIKEGAE